MISEAIKNKKVFLICLVMLGGLVLFGIVRNPQILTATALRGYFVKHKSKQIPPLRGKITDRDGLVMAESLPAISLYLSPNKIKDKVNVVRELKRLTGLPLDVLEKKVSSSKKFVWVERQMDYALKKEVDSLNIKGLDYVGDQKRYYPQGKTASTVIGFCGIDTQPLAGVELWADKVLKKGVDVRLSLSSKLQKGLEGLLEQTAAQRVLNRAGIMVMNPVSGEIIAMAKLPGFDLNRFKEVSVGTYRNVFVTDILDAPSPLVAFLLSALASEKESKKKGSEAFYENLAMSSHDSVRQQMRNISEEELKRYFGQFGLGCTTGISFPGEVLSFYHYERLRHDGSGIAVTPLQLGRLTGAITQKGISAGPVLILGSDTTRKERLMREDTAALLKSALILNGTNWSKTEKIKTGGLSLDLNRYGVTKQPQRCGRAYIGFAEGGPLKNPLVVYAVAEGAHTGTAHIRLFRDSVELLMK